MGCKMRRSILPARRFIPLEDSKNLPVFSAGFPLEGVNWAQMGWYEAGTAAAKHFLHDKHGTMKFAERTGTEPLPHENRSIVRMPLGLLGFEKVKQYTLLADPKEAPFLWLQMLEEPNVSFLVIDPFLLFPDYQPDLTDEDAEFLGLENADDAAVFNIVTLRQDGKANINLKGPIVINRQTLQAKQVIPVNASSYQVQHPFPIAT